MMNEPDPNVQSVATQARGRTPNQVDNPSLADVDTVALDGEPGTPLDDARIARGQAAILLLEAIRATHPERFADVLARQSADLANGLPYRIGRFEILKELGRGGHGIVLLAHDPRLNRRIALKVPRPEALMTSDLRRRFLREAEAAAALNHPNIVPIFEQGSVGPICYVACGYCEGPSLAQWLAGRDEPVPAEWAARIMRTLADAVQHAHSRGVLHRDLKPANVLWVSAIPSSQDANAANPTGGGPTTASGLDLDPSLANGLRLTDFGLARIEGISGQTGSSAIVGTPAYMAPEQASGGNDDVGFATDVYGLGMILYQLLTLQLPFRGRSDIELLQAIQLQEPVGLRKIRREIPRDLEAICLKCLEKSPSRRYPSAAHLYADLARFLDGRPVDARPVTTIVRAQRWCRRNPALATVSLTALILLLVGSVSIFWQWRRAEYNLREAFRQQERATRHLHAAQDAVDELLTDVADELYDLPQTESIRGRLLQKAAQINQRFLQDDAADEIQSEESITAWLRAAQIAKYLGQNERAESALHQVVRLSSTMPAQARTVDIVFAHWQALCLLAGMASNQNDFASAEAFLRQGLSLVHTLPNDKPKRRDFLRAEILRSLGIEAENQDQLREAGKFFQQAVQLVEQYPVNESEEKRLMQIRAKVHGGYAIHCKQMSRFDEALMHFGHCQTALQTLASSSPNSAELQEMLAQNQYNIGNLHLVRKEYETARATYLRAKDDYKRLSERFPQIPRFRERWCYCLEGASLASPLPSQARQRLVLRNKAAFLRRELQREFPQNADNARLLARVNRHLGQDHIQLLEFDKARQCLLRSLECVTPPYTSMEVEIDDLATDAWACSLMGHLEMKCQDWDAALKWFQQAIETREKCPRDNLDANDNLRDHASLGLATIHSGHVGEGLQMVLQLEANSPDAELIVAEALMKSVQILDNDASTWSSSPVARETLVRQVVSHLKSAWQAGKNEAKDLTLNEFQPMLQDVEEYQALAALMSR